MIGFMYQGVCTLAVLTGLFNSECFYDTDVKVFEEVNTQVPSRIVMDELGRVFYSMGDFSESSLFDNHIVYLTQCDSSVSLAAPASIGLLNRDSEAKQTLPIADCFNPKHESQWADNLGFSVALVESTFILEHALNRSLFSGRVLYDSGSLIGENLAITVSGVYNLLPQGTDDLTINSLNAKAREKVDSLPIKFDFRCSVSSESNTCISTHPAAIQYIIDHVLRDSNKFTVAHREANGDTIPYFVMKKIVVVFVNMLEAKCIAYNLAPSILRENVASISGFKPFLDLTSSDHWNTESLPLTMMGATPGAFESAGFCTRNKTMGVSSSLESFSLSFQTALIAAQPELLISTKQQVEQSPSVDMKYDSTKTYIAHVVSDGDNLDMIPYIWEVLTEQYRICKHYAKSGRKCAPRSYTVSPRTDIISPALRKFYSVAKEIGDKASFLMPPSGSRYFYPASANDLYGLDQQRNDTKAAGKLLDMSAAVIWDFFFTFYPITADGFSTAQHEEYMRGFIGSNIEAVFAASAPWLFLPHERFPGRSPSYHSDSVYRDPKNNSKGVLIFNELTRWGETGNGNTVDGMSFTTEEMAKIISKLTPGSLVFVYDILWKVNATSFQKYAEILEEYSGGNAVLVDHRTLISLGKQKHGLS